MNSTIGRIVLYTISGLAAGFVTWVITDLSGLIHIGDNVTRLTTGDVRAQYAANIAFGICVALSLGVADLLLSGSLGQMPRVLAFGVGVGVVAGVIGLVVAMGAFSALYTFPATNPAAFVTNVFARGIGWAVLGAGAGSTDGWRKLSGRVARNGVIGGLIGGFLGGCAFEIVPYLAPGIGVGSVSRLVGFVITAGFIGLFVALVQQLFKEAWIRVVLARNEGRDFLIEKVETRIGRSELADVPLFGDAAVAKIHALIVAQPQGDFLLRDVSNSPAGVMVNEKRVTGETPVQDGDQIQIAKRLLVFRTRMTRTRTAPAPRDLSSRPPAASAHSSPTAAPPRRIAEATLASGMSAPDAQMPHRTWNPPMHQGATRNGHGSRLVATTGPHVGQSFALTPGRAAVIGRDPAAVVALSGDTKTSRAHARVYDINNGGAWIVEDSGSTNGTYVNGQRITQQELVPGDVLVIGTTALLFE
jgi:pSer/pThr/pTyr-binding forkhead associated (FHA) protein